MSRKKFPGIINLMIQHNPEILTGVGIAGMVSAIVLAVKATPKALRIIEHEKDIQQIDDLTKGYIFQKTWKCYLPSAIATVMSTVCLISANSVTLKRNAALTAACAISESALKTYQEKVVETIGEKKEQTVRDAIAQDAIAKHPVEPKEVFITGMGDTLCYESYTGSYFKSDIEKIKKATNDLNRQMLDEMCISLNDFYYEIGRDNTKNGDDVGWNIEDGFIDPVFSSQLTADGTPCLVLDYRVLPKHDFAKLQ